MKLLWLTLEFPPTYGGVGRMYRDLCRVMAKVDNEIWSELASSPAMASDVSEPYVLRRIKLLARYGPWRWWKTLWLLFTRHAGADFNGIIVGQILPLGIPVWIYSYLYPIRYTVFVHGMDVTTAMQVRRHRWLMSRICKRASSIFAANHFVAKALQPLGVSADRMRIIYPAPVLRDMPSPQIIENLRQKEGVGHDELILLTVGRLVERKGHDIVLQALDKVWKKIPRVRYYIIGRGPAEANLRALAGQLLRGNAHNITFLGELSDEEVSAWMGLASIFIMTPRTLPNGDTEGLGIVYLEANYFGKAVIGSNCGGVAEAVIDNATGLLVTENDIEATADAIIKLLCDPRLCARLGNFGRERVIKEFDIRKSAEQIIHEFSRKHD